MTDVRDIPAVATDFLKEQEGLVLRVYDDARPDKILAPGDRAIGTLTGGYGHTGPDVVIGLDVTQDVADRWLAADENTAAARLGKVVSPSVISVLTDHQYAAMISFVFNLGADPDWTIWKRLNAKAFDQVPLEMMRFVNGRENGQLVKMNGLVRRRAAEVALWSTDEPGSVSVADTPPSAVTRVSPTPPTSSDPTPPSKSKMLIAGAASAVAGVPPAISQVSDAIQPYADKSHYVHLVIGGLATIAALCAGLTLVFMWLHKRDARN